MTLERITLDHRTILDQAPVGIVVYGRDLRVLECNAKWAEMVGAAREDIVGLHIDELRDQRHRVALLWALDGVTLAYESPYQATASEAWLWLRATFGPLRDVNSDVSGVIVTASLDRPTGVIGESMAQSSAETQLDETQRFGRIGSWTWDANRRSVAGSPEFFSILGLGSDATGALLDDYKSLIHPEDLAQSLIQLEHAIERRLPVITHEFRLLRPDGTIRWVAVRAQGVFLDGQLLSAWGLVQDVTERRLLEDQLRQAQKMEAMGQLAAGVAHDFNNLLTVITVESEMLAQDVNASPGVQAGVRGIRGAADRAADLTKQLLAFSRKQLVRPRLLDVNDTVAAANQLVRRLIGEDVELVTDLAPHLPPVLADTGQLTQVLVNLAVNARDAMPSGGKLSIATGSELIADVRNEHNLPPGEYVTIVVTDTGHGMNEATRRRIFEPLFTTKAPGHGTGLGLATVYGIIDQLGGHITVASEPDQGATFAMYLLPQPGEAEIPLDSQPGSNGRPGPSGGATVLLVEDEPALRAVCHRVLAREGHSVLLAENGHDALFAAATFPGHIDLLLTDMVLPKLNGREVYDRLREKQEDLRVLYMTGYTDDEMVRRGLIDQRAKVLEKPFAVTELVAAVDDVLGNPGKSATTAGEHDS